MRGQYQLFDTLFVYENYPVDQHPRGSSTLLTLPDDDFPGVANVAVMFAWSGRAGSLKPTP